MIAVWLARKHHYGQKSTVHSRDDKGVEFNVGSWYKVVDSLLPTNRWTDGKNKSKARTISENVYQLQARAIARLVSNSRVYI